MVAIGKSNIQSPDMIVNNERFDRKESCFHYAFYISGIKIATQIVLIKGL